jgi:hypothetical protein
VAAGPRNEPLSPSDAPSPYLDLLQDPDARFRDLGLDHVSRHTGPDASSRCHVRQLEAFGYTVTLAPGV